MSLLENRRCKWNLHVETQTVYVHHVREFHLKNEVLYKITTIIEIA